MFNRHFFSIFNGLDVNRLFLFGWDFPTGGEILGVWGKITTKTSNWRKILAEGTSLRQIAFLSRYA